MQRTQLNAVYVQLFEKLKLAKFLTIQSLEFQGID